MATRSRRTIAGAAALAIGGTLLLVTVPSQANHSTGAGTFTCRASTVRTEGSSVALLNQEPFAANEAGQACTTDQDGLLNDGQPQSVPLANLGTVDVLYARTNGTTHTAESGVAGANLTVAGTPITAGVLTSTASGGTCPAPAFTSSSTIASVTVGTTTVAVPTNADTAPEVTVPGVLTVYVNYQTTTTTGTDQVRTQRALYVDVDQANPLLEAVPDVIIAEAIADTHGDPCPASTTTTSSTTSTSTTSTTTTTTTTVPEGRCPTPSPEGNPETDDSPVDEDCGYGQPSGVTKNPKKR